MITGGFETEVEAPPAQAAIVLQPAEEPQSLVDWRTGKAAHLEEKEKEEAAAVLAWAEKAAKETEDWYNR